ncbi:MAG: amidase [SAR324 cluster bacterium]|nr:amidase [SAR324 cluster bacterium]
MNRLLKLSALQLAQLIHSKEVTSLEVVNTHIARIESVNPELNAVVCNRFEQARAEARKVDEQLHEEQMETIPPLLGVPCTIKECFRVSGMPNTSGLVARKGFVAEDNATAVQRLLKAGAIPLGVTNTSELCMWMETNNRVYGRTNNPYDPARIVGGSSGGEGSIVGAGGVPFGLGSDVGGSIRMPAFFNGVFGHKPTGGLIPNTGQFPVAENNALRYLTTGPLCRKAEDLMPLVRILAGPDGLDEWCHAYNLQDPNEVMVEKLQILNVPGNLRTRVTQDLLDSQSQCADALKKQGANVRTRHIDTLKNSLEIWTTMMVAAGGTPFGTMLGNGNPVRAIPEMVRWLTRRSPHTLPAIMLAFLEKMPFVFKRHIEMRDELRQELVGLIGNHGVMLYPSYSSPAPFHYQPLLNPLDWVFTGIFNVLEFPVTQVPLGLNKDGLPLGIQIVATPGNDHLSIAVAMYLEKIFGGWVPPATF